MNMLKINSINSNLSSRCVHAILRATFHLKSVLSLEQFQLERSFHKHNQESRKLFSACNLKNTEKVLKYKGAEKQKLLFYERTSK